MNNQRLTAISGGIGAGKSIVARILSVMGYRVYDSDKRAKYLMDSSDTIKNQLTHRFGEFIVSEGKINRQKLAAIVFTDKDALNDLNSIVHSAVIADVNEWRKYFAEEHLFIETAILYQSGLDKLVDDVWEVVASESTRVNRIIARNGITREEAMQRIESQRIDIASPHPVVHFIDNSGALPLLPQIHSLL